MTTLIYDQRKCVLQTVCGMTPPVRSASWEEWLPNLPLGDDVDSEFLDMTDRQNLVQVSG